MERIEYITTKLKWDTMIKWDVMMKMINDADEKQLHG